MSASGSNGPVGSQPVEYFSSGRMQLWVTVRFGRKFILKGLAPSLRNKPEWEALLRKEFELGMKLDHPGLARVWQLERMPEIGTVIVMDFIEGRTLSEFLHSREAESAVIRLRLVSELAEAIAYIHSQGVSHRDIKPDNIIVTSGGHIKLIDLGLGDSREFTHFKDSAATVGFGAPEQLEAQRGDERSDVYSFGKVASLMSLPRSAQRVIRKCLTAQPERRPTMSQVCSALGRRRFLTWTSVGACVAAVVIAVGAFTLLETVDSEARHFVPEATAAETGATGQYRATTMAEEPKGVPEPVAQPKPAQEPVPHPRTAPPRAASPAEICGYFSDLVISRTKALYEQREHADDFESKNQLTNSITEINYLLQDAMIDSLTAVGASAEEVNACQMSYWLAVSQRSAAIMRAAQQ